MSLLLFFSPTLDSVILSAFSSLFNGYKTFQKLDRLFVTLITQKHLCQEPGCHLFEMQTLGELPISSFYGRAGTGLWWALSSKLSYKYEKFALLPNKANELTQMVTPITR